jgi:hypothetical protein
MKSTSRVAGIVIMAVLVLVHVMVILAQPPTPPDVLVLTTPIRLSADPETIPADGSSTATITADVVWPDGWGELSGTPACLVKVYFYTTQGNITSYNITMPTPDNQSCSTLATLTAGMDTGTATIMAWADIAPNESVIVRNSTTINFSVPTVFDTGSPAIPYPSISGTHNGTITLRYPLVVSKLYTYSCPGTGGHSTYIKIWNTSWAGVEAEWASYDDEWQTISFSSPFVLEANETYNYTIRTGSYPQIVHEASFVAKGVIITCTEFWDSNGKKGYNWIPAIRLENASE